MSARRLQLGPLLLVWAGCGPGGSSGSPAPHPTSQLVLRPGDSLLDHLDEFRVESYPETSLPPGVAERLRADPSVPDALRYERSALAGDELPGGGPATVPSPASLRIREHLGNVSRDCVLLPAPGRLSLDIGELAADELTVAVGLLDHAYGVQKGALREVERASDGATFAVEVTAGGETRRVWQESLAREQCGSAFVEARIPLAELEGSALTLTLVTEPGASGDASYDYALWGDLCVRGEPARSPERPHVVLIDVDTLRSDRLGCYGHARATSPRLDAWAAREAVVYLDNSSTAGWTLPATASMLTGLAVHQHGATSFSNAVSAQTPTLAGYLREAGYETFGTADGSVLRPRFGFGQGFDVYDGDRSVQGDWKRELEWIRARRSERPFFLFLQTYRVHAPYRWDERFVDPGYDGRWKGRAIEYEHFIDPFCEGKLVLADEEKQLASDLYDAQIHEVDRMLGDFLAGLEAAVSGQPYLVIVTSDHGEEFFEHGKMAHGFSLYEEVLQVPLIVRFPAATGRGPGRVQERTSILDIVPTVLDVAGLPLPEALPGRSLLRPLDPAASFVAQHGSKTRTIRHGSYKLIDGHIKRRGGRQLGSQLFDLEDDPGERRNLLYKEPKLVRTLHSRLSAYLKKYPRLERLEPEVTDEALQELMADLQRMGYTGEEGQD
jgi:arylsulfatase A-like enzyme